MENNLHDIKVYSDQNHNTIIENETFAQTTWSVVPRLEKGETHKIVVMHLHGKIATIYEQR